MEGSDAAAIEAKTQTLAQASMKLGEAMYAASQAGAGGEPGADAAASGGGDKNEDVVDADFEEVDDDKKKSA
jgi:molecular chaperone DnaK